MKRTILSLLCLQTLLLSTTAHAEEIASGANSITLDEMIVTTRKREELLQQVPMAITAFSAELIQDAGLQSIEDIALMTPGFTFTQLFGYLGNPVIRGETTTIGEPNVGFFIDGGYQQSRIAMEAMFGDELERIEVAKGPQNALYGRNTFAGAINYVTKKPTNESKGKFEITLGNEGRQDARFSHSGAISQDSLFYRVGAMHSSSDGFYDNELDGSHLDTKQSNVYSLSLLALPADNVEMVFRIGIENTNDGDDAIQFVDNNAFGALPIAHPVLASFNQPQLITGGIPSVTDGFAVTPGHNERDNITTSFRLDWDLTNVTFTSITAYNDLEIDTAVDLDYSAADVQFSNIQTDQDEFSQELRLTSAHQAVRWMAGLYYYNLDRDSDTQIAQLAFDSSSKESTRNWAGFGSLGFDLTDQWALTLSGRYSYERKQSKLAVQENPNGFNESATFKNFMPKIALDYQLTEDAMVYASVAKAVKSGGFNTAVAGTVPTEDERAFDEEKSLNYEIGVKSAWFDNRLTANLALFYIKWDDQIVRSLGTGLPPALLNANAGESTSQGFELEIAAIPAKNWDVALGLAYTDAHYDEYTFAVLPLFGINPTLDGNDIQFVSEWTANASVQYVMPHGVAGLDWKTRADVMYQSEQAIQAIDNIAVLPDRTIVNLRTGLENKRYSLNLWVKNLFDDDESINAIPFTNPANPLVAFQAVVGAPVERTYGVTASIKF